MTQFNGLGLHLGNLSRLSRAKTRSISAENPTGEKGRGGMAPPDPNGSARDLGLGWKCRPAVPVEQGQTVTLADIEGPGAIQSIWFGGTVMNRDAILRIYWDGQDAPSVECPLSDFFAQPWPLQDPRRPTAGPFAPVNSLPVSVNACRGMNCFWEMPFRSRCRMTVENRSPRDSMRVYYQINYALTDVPDDAAYLHAQFRRVNPLPYGEVYTIVDGIEGEGHYVGVSLGVGVNNDGWWGEGEIKFYIDGDGDWPTICGTGTEDYFGGSYNWEVDGEYVTYSTPYLGMHQVLRPDGLYRSQHRHAMYRWHVMDPVRFENDLRVTIQALGWTTEGRFLPGTHDMCSVAYWYQALPAAPFPPLPSRDALVVL